MKRLRGNGADEVDWSAGHAHLARGAAAWADALSPTPERARLILDSRDKAVLEQLAASYRAQEKVVTDRRDQREMDDIGARRARLAQTEDQDDGEQGGRS